MHTAEKRLRRAERQSGEGKVPFHEGKGPLTHSRDFSKAKREWSRLSFATLPKIGAARSKPEL
jgi:hypothetical protein